MDTVTVEVEVNEGVATDEEYLQQIFKTHIKDIVGLPMNIDFKAPGAIPRSEGGKLSRILDKRRDELRFFIQNDKIVFQYQGFMICLSSS